MQDPSKLRVTIIHTKRNGKWVVFVNGIIYKAYNSLLLAEECRERLKQRAERLQARD